MPPVNLLHTEPTDLLCTFSSCPPRPPLPPMGSARWQAALGNPVMQVARQQLLDLAASEIDTPLPELTDALYADFHQTGARLPFERPYFERRRRLARAAIALLDADTPPRRASFLGKLRSVFSEESWAVPAHTAGSPTGKAPLIIDLFAAETANLFAECLVVFGEIIPEIFRAEILQRLRRQFFENYLATDFNWLKVTNNWNAVCHQGVIGAALQVESDADLLARMITKMRTHLPGFLAGYESDGGSSEGPAYWEYGFGWYAVLNEQLESRTQGALSLFTDDAKVREIAKFAPRLVLAGGHVVNFSDGPARFRLRPHLCAYLGERLADADCQYQSREGYRHVREQGVDIHAERTDFFFLARLFLHAPEHLATAEAHSPEDVYFPGLAVLVSHGIDSRGHLWDFAAKAGHNTEHHNHNDLGSFLLNIDGARLITEIGSPEYVQAFFSPERYTFLAARSLGHSVPLINGHEQADGPQHAAVVKDIATTSSESRFVLDTTQAYPPEAGCREYARAFHFQKSEGRLTVQDTVTTEGAHQVETAIISHQPIVIEDGRATIQATPLILIITPATGTLLARVETHPYRTHSGDDDKIYRLVLTPATPAAKATLAYTLTLAD